MERLAKYEDREENKESEKTLKLSEQELKTIKQWYNAVQDLNPSYLAKSDKRLIRKITDFTNNL